LVVEWMGVHMFDVREWSSFGVRWLAGRWRKPVVLVVAPLLVVATRCWSVMGTAWGRLSRCDVDPLTGLGNRRVVDRLGRDLDRGAARVSTRQVWVAYGDLDGFKQVNDALGHRCGDAVLVATAAELRAATRTGDVVSRVGGDEFVVVLADTADVDAPAVVDRLTRRLADNPRMRGCTMSFGLVPLVCPGEGPHLGDGDSRAALANAVDRADQALRLAKQLGGNRVCVNTVWHPAQPAA